MFSELQTFNFFEKYVVLFENYFVHLHSKYVRHYPLGKCSLNYILK